MSMAAERALLILDRILAAIQLVKAVRFKILDEG